MDLASWNVEHCNIPMVVSKWSPEEEEEEEVEITTITMWVTLKNVLRRMFSWKGLEFIASAVGKPKRLHPDTLLCKSFEEAKIFVEADMTKELPKSHHFKSNLGVAADVQFVYPWLPTKCNLCSKWGHVGAKCSGKGKSIRILQRKEVEEGLSKELEGSESSSKQIEQKSDTSSVALLAVEPVVTQGVEEERSLDDGEEKSEDENIVVDQNQILDDAGEHQQMEEHKETEDDWSNVSPGKQARSNSQINADSNIISSPSRFAILGEDQDERENILNEEEGESEEGEILEKQLPMESDTHKRNEQQKQEIVDEVNTRRTSTRNAKVQSKNGGDTKTQSTSSFASTMGKKRNTKKC